MRLLWQETNTHPVVTDRSFKRFLRYPPARPLEGPLAENAAWARAWFAEHGRPWHCAIAIDRSACPLLADRLPEAREMAIIAVCAGAEAEIEAAARWTGDEPDRYFFLESLASAVVDALLDAARVRLGATQYYCPGYRGWPIETNASLLALLETAHALPAQLTVLSSGTLKPKKSQIAVCAFSPTPAASA